MLLGLCRLDMGLGSGVVLVVVDGVADIILALVDVLSLLLIEGSAIGLAILAGGLVDVGFAVFEVGGAAGGDLTGTYALGYALLLVSGAVANGSAGGNGPLGSTDAGLRGDLGVSAVG